MAKTKEWYTAAISAIDAAVAKGSLTIDVLGTSMRFVGNGQMLNTRKAYEEALELHYGQESGQPEDAADTEGQGVDDGDAGTGDEPAGDSDGDAGDVASEEETGTAEG